MRTPALIFDFGNVVAHFDYVRAAGRLGSKAGLPGEALLARLRSMGWNPVVREYERGRMSAEDFGRAVCAMAGLEVPHEEFRGAWCDIFSANEPVAGLVAHLKARGYTLVLGSNTNDMHAAHFQRQFAGTLAHFDRLVLSHEVGHVKPSAEFYLACAEAAGAPTGDCVFIDDMAENVEGARAAGLGALHYRGFPTLLAELGELGVEVPGR